MLLKKSAEGLNGGIQFIDLGASGDASKYWEKLAPLINLIGFDPNEAECERLNSQKSVYHSRRFLPYAITGTSGEYSLHKTKSIYCWSLLTPNLPWLQRFEFGHYFEVEGTEQIQGYALDGIAELKSVDVDIMKVDTQGLELQILKGGERTLRNSIMIETETGFVKNYFGETTFDEVAEYLKAKGFGLFFINSTRQQPRKNSMSRFAENEELLWCEAIWFRDYKNPASSAAIASLTREKALKALCIYANHGCLSFGLEMAEVFYDKGLISQSEWQELSGDPQAWELPQKNSKEEKESRLRKLIRYIPRKFYSPMLFHLNDLKNTPHPFSRGV
jgi:FkbM family methyltransferase